MEKLLFLDIDGTLAYPREDPSPATVEAIRRARTKGHRVFLSTGRTEDTVPEAVRAIGFDGGIYSAGGRVICGDRLLAQHFMPQPLVEKTLSLLQGALTFYKLETAGGIFRNESAGDILSRLDLTGASSEMRHFAQQTLLNKHLMPLTRYGGEPVYKISFFSADPTLTQTLADALEGTAKVVSFDNLVPGFPLKAGEVSALSVHKGLALREICRHLGKDEADCVAFGDSMNDAEMLTSAGLGIAMGNGEPRLKAVADMVCDSCDCDGLAKALYALGLADPPEE